MRSSCVILVVLGSLATACGASSPPAAAPAPAVAPVAVPDVAAPVALGAACDGASLLQTPEAFDAAGPWPVGARTVVADGLTLEVWYPARPGSDAGQPRARYDLREVMPPAEAAKIPDEDNAWLDCACHRDLPLDDAHGPYPVVVFLHGAASFRAQSAFLAAHWASRGFVVVAPDVPGAGLAAALGEAQGGTLAAPGLVAEVVARGDGGAADPLAFVRAHLAPRVAVAGHSLGSMLATTIADRDEVAATIAMAGALIRGRGPALLLVGDRDGIAPADRARAGFDDAPAGDELVIVRGAGHLAFSDLCLLGADRGGALAIARAHGVAVPDLVAELSQDGCRADDAPFAQTAPAIRAATAARLEATLRCDPRGEAALAALPQAFDVERLVGGGQAR